MTNTRSANIETILSDAFSPDELLVKDQSHLHAGHAGAKDGRGHFEVMIVAEAFRNRSRIECHRLVYEALEGMVGSEIHALAMRTQSPAESA